MAMEMKKRRVRMVKPLYLGMSILDIGKTLTILDQSTETRLCYTDTDSFIINIKTEKSLKIFPMMLRGLIHLIIMKMIKDLFQ